MHDPSAGGPTPPGAPTPAPSPEAGPDVEPAGRAPPWLLEAEAILRGEREMSDGLWLIHLAAVLDRSLPLVGLPWCGLFVAHCLETTRPGLELPRRRAQSRPWLDFGEPAEPQLGAILVFWVIAPRSGLGHVGFYHGEDDTHFHVLGGNQQDRVMVQRWPRERLLACRWPDAGWPAEGSKVRRSPEAAETVRFRFPF